MSTLTALDIPNLSPKSHINEAASIWKIRDKLTTTWNLPEDLASACTIYELRHWPELQLEKSLLGVYINLGLIEFQAIWHKDAAEAFMRLGNKDVKYWLSFRSYHLPNNDTRMSFVLIQLDKKGAASN